MAGVGGVLGWVDGSYLKLLQNSFANFAGLSATGVPLARDAGRKKDSPLPLGHAADKPAQSRNVRLGIARSARLTAKNSSVIVVYQLHQLASDSLGVFAHRQAVCPKASEKCHLLISRNAQGTLQPEIRHTSARVAI